MKIGRKYYTPQLPLSRGKSFDYEYIDTTIDLVRQNFKNLLLTSPGERVMDPEFGVGTRRYLFESMDFVKRELPNKIRNQLSRYMPFVTLKTLNVEETGDNSLSVKITYEVPSLGQSDVLNIDSKSTSSTGGPKFVI